MEHNSPHGPFQSTEALNLDRDELSVHWPTDKKRFHVFTAVQRHDVCLVRDVVGTRDVALAQQEKVRARGGEVREAFLVKRLFKKKRKEVAMRRDHARASCWLLPPPSLLACVCIEENLHLTSARLRQHAGFGIQLQNGKR